VKDILNQEKTEYQKNSEAYGVYLNSPKKPIKQFVKKKIVKKIKNLNFIENKPIDRLSPDNQDRLLHEHINETNIYEKDIIRDKDLHYFKSEIEQTDILRETTKPTATGVIGAMAYKLGNKNKKFINAGIGGTAGYHGYSIIENTVDVISKNRKNTIAERYMKRNEEEKKKQ